MEKEPRIFKGWESLGESITKDTVISTEGQTPPPPKFEAPEWFTDLDGVSYKYGGRLTKEGHPEKVSHFYYIPEPVKEGEKPMSKTQRVIRETYLRDVLERQAYEREKEEGGENGKTTSR